MKRLQKITAIILTLSLILSIIYINPIRSLAADPVNQNAVADSQQTTPPLSSPADQNSPEDNNPNSSPAETPQTPAQGITDNVDQSDISITANPETGLVNTEKTNIDDSQEEIEKTEERETSEQKLITLENLDSILEPGKIDNNRWEWAPGTIYELVTTGKATLVKDTTNDIPKAAAMTATVANPSLDINQIQLFLNNIAGRRATNHSDCPELADRRNVDEYIDEKSAGTLSLRQADLTLPGRDGLDLVISRYYNSSQAALGTRKVCLESYQGTNQGECTYGWELYMTNMKGQRSYYGLYDNIDAANLVGEQKYNDELDQWYSYTVYQRNMKIGENYTAIKFKNYSDTNNYLRNRYDLGAGWSFGFPSIERREGDTLLDTTTYLTFYDGKGGAYEINITSDAADSNLSGYQGKDIVVDRCSTLGKSYANGVESAVYAYLESGQKEYYFSWDGRLLGIKDKKGNEIRFTYITRNVYGKNQQYIRQITDTVGRTATFTYNDNPDMSGRIDILVNDPSGKNLTLSYVKDSFSYNYSEYTWDAFCTKITHENPYCYRQEPRLIKYMNPQGNETSYTYENKPVDFAFNWQDISFSSVGLRNCQDTVCMLTKVQYPHSSTSYTNTQGNKVLAKDGGHYKECIVTERHDNELYNHSGTVSEGPAKNQVTYSNTGNYTYKLWHQSDRTYDFVSVANGVTTTQTFNMKGQETKKSSSDGVKKVETFSDDWDNRFELKARRTTVAESGPPDGSKVMIMILRSFNDWGGLESYSDGTWGEHIEDRKQYYYYTDAANKYMLTRKQWKQNATTPLSESYQYNSQGRLIKVTDVNGNEINYSYTNTADGMVKQTTQALEDGKTAQLTEIYGPQSQNAYPTEIRQYYTGAANGYSKTTTTYNMLLGLPETVSDDAGKQTAYSYDNLGRVTSIRLPDINNYEVRQTFTYTNGASSTLFDTTNQNLMTTLVDSSTLYKNQSTGQEQSYNHHQTYYNAYGQLILDSVFDNQQNTWLSTRQCHYDIYGNLIYEIDALGNINTYQYDGWGNLVSSIDPYGNTYREDKQFVDNLGIVTDYFLAAGSSTPEHRFETYYDYCDRVYKQQAQPSGLAESYEYDEADNIVKHTDPRGNSYNYSYDKKNQVTSVTDPLNQTSHYTYTRLGKINGVTLTDGAQTFLTSYQYNEIGQQTQKTDPGGLTDTTTYNNLGLVSSSSDPNGTPFNFTYDAHNRLTSQSGGGITTQYQYTNSPYGLDTVTLNNGSSTHYSYDGLGRVAAQTTSIDGTGSTVNYQYDNAGKLTSITGPTGQSTSYHYDKTRVDQVQYDGKNVTYEYYPDGMIKTVSYPAFSDGSILKSSYEYDDLNRLIRLSNQKGAAVLSQYQYTYDNNSNIQTITTPAGTTTYSYDPLNRLIQIQPPDGTTITYTYDGRGNRKTSENDLLLTKSNPVDYSYNALDQLTGVSISGQSSSYDYDPTGLRIKKTTPTDTTRYTYDHSQRMIAETNGTQHAKYIWGPDKLLVKKDTNNQEYYYIYNGHGDVVQILNTAGEVVNSYEYDEWGNILNQTETVPNSFKYCGETQDSETGFYYLRARYYDPTLGRFISKDSYEGSITNPLSLNLYAYCTNNPIIYVDPSGCFGESASNWMFDFNAKHIGGPLNRFNDKYIGGPLNQIASGDYTPVEPVWDFIEPSEADVAYFQSGGPYGPVTGAAGYIVRRGGKLVRLGDNAFELGEKATKGSGKKAVTNTAKISLKSLNNKEANILAQKLGYKGAEEFKKEFVGTAGAKFNIKYDSKTGEIILESIKDTSVQFHTGLFRP